MSTYSVEEFITAVAQGDAAQAPFQLKFEGRGWVVLQPYEETYYQRQGGGG